MPERTYSIASISIISLTLTLQLGGYFILIEPSKHSVRIDIIYYQSSSSARAVSSYQFLNATVEWTCRIRTSTYLYMIYIPHENIYTYIQHNTVPNISIIRYRLDYISIANLFYSDQLTYLPSMKKNEKRRKWRKKN